MLALGFPKASILALGSAAGHDAARAGRAGSWVVLALGLAGTSAVAGTMSGTVMSNGNPLPGTMVTAFSPDKQRRDTAYTDANGRYTLSVDFGGKFEVRARMMYHKDQTAEVSLPKVGATTGKGRLNRLSSRHRSHWRWPGH